MKGFKSFADNTVLEFEPGVTAVVGPNGSGKSNVVDAVTWVLGAQSSRALRGGKMEDVIFAGTTARPALGRAEVSLTLDNASGRLPVDGAEVTISRTLFRDNESEYAINGVTCRLLDVQELLSDSGVGRQQHMIIGQGQLDSILNSNPENRRSVIEEAAGVLKFRRRKERAERRLAQTQENLERLGDLVREVRRQMRPLERQAASARSYSDVEAELRAARELFYATRLQRISARREALEVIVRSGGERERALRGEVATLDAQATAAAAEMASRREEMLASTLGTLQGLAERAKGTSSLIAERDRSLRQALIASADENVIATLEADAARLADDLALLETEEQNLRARADEVSRRQQELADAETSFENTWANSSVTVDRNALADARERISLLERAQQAWLETHRRADQRLADLRERMAEVTGRHEALHAAVTTATANLTEAERAREMAEGAANDAENERRRCDEELRGATETSARAQARAEALARAFDELSGAGGREIIGNLEGVLGSFLDLIDVTSGWERAIESAAGASVGAMVVDGKKSARAALEAIRREGGVGLVLPVGEATVSSGSVPSGCRSLRELVSARAGAPDHVERVLDALFARAVVAPDWESAIEIALSNPELVVVTAEGDRFAATGWRVASGRAVVTRGTVEESARAAQAAAQALEPLLAARSAAEEAVTRARRVLSDATTALANARAEVERVTLEASRNDEASANAVDELDELTREVEALRVQGTQLDEELLALRATLPALEAAVAGADDYEARYNAARATLEQLRTEVGAVVTDASRREAEFAERRRLIESRRAEIESRLEGRSSERAQAAERRERLEFDLEVLARLDVLVARAADDIRLSQEAMASTYQEQLEASRASAERLEEIRQARNEVDAQLSGLGDQVRQAEIETAELNVLVSTLHDNVRRDLGREPHELPAVTEVVDEATLEASVAELELRINSLGPINPLALEELAQLEERYRDLDTQVSDVRNARRELHEAIRTLDQEIMEQFVTAFSDVNENFSTLIAMLFPGGQGRLLLTEPDDPLNTGVEIEVRPMGRNVRRISLLSGGERSMAALAFLFSVFRSRPSPFYMMDEVEAALDDVNLQRFLSLVNEFRDEAQLIIVTHQKRTMENADALYGVTMVPGHSSKVVSQRVKRETEVVVAQ